MNVSTPPSVATQPDRQELLFTLVLECLFYGFLLYLFFIAADRYADAFSYRNPSVVLFVFHWIFLYVHEGGHFLFSFFGKTLAILGGSFWQVMFPLLAFVIALRDRSRIAPFASFLTGFNLLAVSLYMRDARLRLLPLLGGDKRRHDWWNLFREWNMLDSAEIFADVTYGVGIVLCVGSVAAGLFLAFKAFFKPKTIAPKEITTTLDQTLAKRRVETS